MGEAQAGLRRLGARERCVLLKTCDAWSARALRSAGVPITPLLAVTAGGLMEQARRVGRVVRLAKPAGVARAGLSR
jgi:hypothetical protein